jgi:hypothetical protein
MKIARHRGMKKAIVALARRLAVIMHRGAGEQHDARLRPGGGTAPVSAGRSGRAVWPASLIGGDENLTLVHQPLSSRAM